MSYLVSVDPKEWQCISPAVIVKVLKKCPLSNVVDGTDNGMLWNGGQEDGISMRKIKALTVNVEKVTLFGKCR